MAIQAIESGHHVVIEKPMALTLADASKVVYTSLRFRKSGILRNAKPIFPAFGLDQGDG